MNSIGKKIKELRISRGLTMDQLGSKIGVQKAAVQKYESGAVTNIKPEVVFKICDALDVSPSVLMGWRRDGSSEELDLIDEVGQSYGVDVAAMVASAASMNEVGRHTVMRIVADFALIPKYKAKD